MALLNNLIIPERYLDERLPEGADNTNDRLTNAVTEATVFVNTYAQDYMEFDAYTIDEGSGDNDDDIILNAPREVVQICLEVAKIFYYQSIDESIRDGGEWERWNSQLEYYRGVLKDIRIGPKKYSLAISLDSNNAQLIARNQRIIPWNAYIESATTNVWNMGEDFVLRKGGAYDNEYYDGWYLDANGDSDVEGTLYYFRSFRRDTKDYIAVSKTGYRHN